MTATILKTEPYHFTIASSSFAFSKQEENLVVLAISDFFSTDSWSLLDRHLDANLYTQEMLNEAFWKISTHFGEETDAALKKLLEKGADVNAEDCFALNYACYCGLTLKGLEERVFFLLDHGADPKQSDRPLLVRVSPYPTLVKRFLELGMDPNQRGIISDVVGSAGPLDALTFAIRRFRSHFSPDMGVEEERILESVKLLVEAGANPHKKSLGKTPIEHAKELGFHRVAEYLSER